MAEANVNVRRSPKVSAIWLVPVVAAVLGLWLVIYTYITEGPEVTVTFSTAEGIEPGKTKIKNRDVELGVVETVELTKDLQRVVVTARLEKFARPLLRDDTQFWVVRARAGPGGITGLGTLLSGSYIRMAAGSGDEGEREFEGLDAPPLTPAGTPGLRLFLDSVSAGSVSAGDPVLYRGYAVGKVDGAIFNPETRLMNYELFINQPYDVLVSENTRFWNTSGIELNASADGVNLEIGSLQSLLVGGISFDLPDGAPPGTPAQNGDRFSLYANKKVIDERVYRKHVEYVVSFPQSVRGVQAGAPVEYRGIRMGTVQRILLDEWIQEDLRTSIQEIPVLIRIEPGRVNLPDDATGVARMEQSLRDGVAVGLRATLKTGNLLTGSAYVEFDFFPQASPAQLGKFAGYVKIPTLPRGIDRLDQQLGQLLAKLNALPLEPVFDSLNSTLLALRETLIPIQSIAGSDETQAIPATINSTLFELQTTLDDLSPDSESGERLNRLLGELNETLRNVDELVRTLSNQPSSILFPPPAIEDPVPQKGPSQ